MQEVDQLVKMANQIADNFSFHDDAAGRVADHLKRFWAPSMRQSLVELDATRGAALNDVAREALQILEAE